MTTEPGWAPFCGAKLVLKNNGRLLVYLRDDFAHIPFPAYWDLPGGGREGFESPAACALRELYEEFGLRLDPARITSHQVTSFHRPDMRSWLFSGHLTDAEIALIRFCDEGQEWRLMHAAEFLGHPRAVPYLVGWIRDFGLG